MTPRRNNTFDDLPEQIDRYTDPWRGLGPLQRLTARLISRWIKHWRSALMVMCTLGVTLAIAAAVTYVQGAPSVALCILIPLAMATLLAVMTILLEI